MAARPADQSGVIRPGAMRSRMTPQTVPIGIATAPRLTAAESDRSRRPIPIPHTPLCAVRRVRRGRLRLRGDDGRGDLGARRGAHPAYSGARSVAKPSLPWKASARVRIAAMLRGPGVAST